MDRPISKAKLKYVDLISINSALWETSQFEIVKEHVYGHQDNINRILTQLEELNLRIDIKVKDIAQDYINSNSAPPAFRITKLGFGTVNCGDTLVTSRLQYTCENTIITRTGTKYIPIFRSYPITGESLTFISIMRNNNCYVPS